jgi:hypothetical protein
MLVFYRIKKKKINMVQPSRTPVLTSAPTLMNSTGYRNPDEDGRDGNFFFVIINNK